MRRRWLLATTVQRLKEAGADVVVHDSTDVAEGRRLAKQAIETGTFDAIVAAGGDSTVRTVAAVLLGSNLPLGIIPVGTGNVLAHEIGIRVGPGRLAEYLLSGPDRPVRCGLANDKVFLSMAGAGFDGRVLERLDVPTKRRFGKLAYVWPAMQELLKPQRTFKVTIDGMKLEATWLIASRIAHYAGPFVLAPDQTLANEQIRAVVVKAPTRRSHFGALLSLAVGRSSRNLHIRTLDCKNVVVEGARELTTHIDGEPKRRRQFNISMSPHRLSLIFPPW